MRHSLVSLVALFLSTGFFTSLGSAPGAAATDTENVVVVITLREQPALTVMTGLRPEFTRSATDRDAVDARLQREALDRIADLVGPVQERVARAVEAHGGAVLSRLRGYGAIVARLPRLARRDLERLPDVLSVELESQYRRTGDAAAGVETTVPQVVAGALSGTVDLAIVDTGVKTDHPAFATHSRTLTSAIFHNSARLQRDYADDYLDPEDRQGHGTSVAGVLFARSAASWVSGAAPGLTVVDHIYNLKAAYRASDGASHATQGDVMTAIDASLGFSDPPEVINYSYGSDAVVDDDGYCRFFDNVVDTFGRTMTLSAGNGGLRSIGTPGIAYNVISVANVNDRGTPERSDDAIAATSSAGPTPGGRKKPDLAALGSHVSTASRAGGFEQVTGTSFAAPAIAADAALLIDGGTVDPRAVKAVLINSADDFGEPGWDVDFGWGYVNAARAMENRRRYVTNALSSDRQRRLYVQQRFEPAKATLVWNRHVTEGASYLNDLDLLLYDETTGGLLDSSTSPIDNVEQVSSSTATHAVLVVEGRREITGGREAFALAHSGEMVERNGPDVRVRLTAPRAGRGEDTLDIRAHVTNTGDIVGHGFDVVLQTPDGYTADGLRRYVGSLSPGASTTVTWRVRKAGPVTGDALVRAVAEVHCYGWSWSDTTTLDIGAH